MRLGTAGILNGWALQGYSTLGDCRIFRLGTVGLCGWASRDTWRLDVAGVLNSWALQGYFVGGRALDTWCLATAKTERIGMILCGWALRGHLVHCRNNWWLGTAGTLGGWALQGCLVVGHGMDALRLGPAVRRRAEGEDNIDFKI